MNIAKFSAGKIGLLRMGAAAAVLAASLCAAVPASADASIGQPSPLGALRLGTFLPVNSNTQSPYGNYMWNAGLDFTIQQSGPSIRDIISVDYIQLSRNGHSFQDIPVTIGQQMLFGSHAPGTRPYVGYGIGLYNIRLTAPNNLAFSGRSGVSAAQFGGYLNAGLDIGSQYFLDARYHITPALKDVDTDGFSVTAGVRF